MVMSSRGKTDMTIAIFQTEVFQTGWPGLERLREAPENKVTTGASQPSPVQARPSHE